MRGIPVFISLVFISCSGSRSADPARFGLGLKDKPVRKVNLRAVKHPLLVNFTYEYVPYTPEEKEKKVYQKHWKPHSIEQQFKNGVLTVSFLKPGSGEKYDGNVRIAGDSLFLYTWMTDISSM